MTSDPEDILDALVGVFDETAKLQKKLDDSVGRMNESADKVPQVVADQLNRHAGSFFTEELSKIREEASEEAAAADKRNRDLNAAVQKHNAERRKHRAREMWFLGFLVVGFSGLFAFGHFYLGPKQEQESLVFGARFLEQDGKQYVFFDENIKLYKVKCDVNCFEIIR